jgi:hypothetical protein
MAQGAERGGAAAAPEPWQWACDTATRTVQRLGISLHIKVHHPGSDPGLLSAIAAIRAFRAEVYYAGWQ